MITTRQQAIEYIRTKCIEANPSIKDLVRGCYITMYSDAIRKSNLEEADDSDVTCMVLDYDAGGKNPTDDYDGDTLRVYCVDWGSSASFGEHGDDSDMPDYEIIGRPIRLADVLLAIRAKVQNEDDYMVMLDGAFCTEEMSGMESFIQPIFKRNKPVEWNLKQDDLASQSPECIDFLAELLHD